MGQPGVSVVIPAIDEADHLPGLLADLRRQRDVDLEIIVADGGSRDASRAAVEAAGARWLDVEPGRGRQMNAGAEIAHHDWLLFIHADCRLTQAGQLRAACDVLGAAGGNGRPVAGHFALRFVDADDRFLFRYMVAKTATGRRYTINGDQACLIDRAEFAALGGFDTALAFLEDQRLASAVVAAGGRWQRLPGEITTSARRFIAEGPRRRYWLMGLIMMMHVAEVPQFFERAPRVYARQGTTARLALAPYIALIGSMAARSGFRASVAAAWRVAGFLLGQAWQIPFAVDVWRAAGAPVDDRLARGYERRLARLVEQPPAQTLVLIVLLGFFLGPAMILALGRSFFYRGRQ